MMRAGQQKRVAEFAEIVASCRSSAELWGRVLHWLQTHVGFDAGYAGTTLGSTLDSQGAILEHDAEAYRANIGRYLAEITAEEVAAYTNRACAHTDVWSQSRRARMQVFREVLDPSGAKHVAVQVSVRQNVLLGFNLERRSGPPFGDDDLSLVDAVAPIIHLGDAVTRALSRGENKLGDWAEEYGLSPREKEIADLVARGLTNAEIARLLNIAEFTVRNTLVRVFEKTGVTRRTELTFEALQGGAPAQASRRQRRDLLSVFYQRAAESARLRTPSIPSGPGELSVVLARQR